MSNSVHEKGSEDKAMENFFDQAFENSRTKMIKVSADQYPYAFYVTADQDFEDTLLKIADLNAPEREVGKCAPFNDLEKLSEIDKEVEKRFHGIMSEFEKKKLSLEVKQDLELMKKECAEVFQMFDDIISLCKEYFELEYADCDKRVEKHLMFQGPLLDNVQNFLIEIEEFGNSELESLHSKISNWIYNRGFSRLDNIDKAYNILSDQPSAMQVWFDHSAELTSKEVRDAFLAGQKEMCAKWKRAFEDLLMLSEKLEKCRCNYNLMKFKLEREIYWMSRNYKENMPKLTKNQRRLTCLKEEKASLARKIKNLQSEIKKARRKLLDVRNEGSRKITTLRANNESVNKAATKKFENILNCKKEEIYNDLSDILRDDKLIHENILGVFWNPIDLSHLKPADAEIDKDHTEKDEFTIQLEKVLSSFDSPKSPRIADEDDLLDAYEILATSEHFVTLLNMVADELGYILDFAWVDYVKEKLELTPEVKWVELFKVFKINFVEEAKSLKDHMMSYCKIDDNEEVVFDVQGAVKGFVNYVWKQRQLSTQKEPPSLNYDPDEYKNYWSSAIDLIPKTLLWESVEDILFQYRALLEERSSLLQERRSLIADNNEFGKYLENYHKYGTCH